MLYALRKRWAMALLITLFIAALAVLVTILLFPHRNIYFDAWYV
ncbi:MAG: hypothetical protein WDA65_05685 [Christensenellales bacterium]